MPKDKKKGYMARTKYGLTHFDMFGETAAFTINGRSSHNGVCGTCVTLLICVLVLSYGLHRLSIVYTRGDTTFQKSIVKDNLDKSKAFSFEDTHFNFAIGIAGLDT